MRLAHHSSTRPGAFRRRPTALVRAGPPATTTQTKQVTTPIRVAALPQGHRQSRWPISVLPKLSPEDYAVAAIIGVYGVQGFIELATPAITYFFKDDLHLDPGQAAAWLTLINLPWCLKPLIGFVSDTVPLWGYRRRSYLMLSSAAAAGSWALLATCVDSTEAAVAALFIGAMAIACSDVIADSMVVERARGESEAAAGTLQSLCWAAYSVGTLATAYLSGKLIQDHGTRFVFGMTAFFPLLVGAVSVMIPEAKVEANSKTGSADADPDETATAMGAAKEQLTSLWAAVNRREVIAPLAFLMLLSSTPSPDTAMFFYQTEVLGLTPEFLGEVQMAASIASLAGVGLYQAALKEVPLRTMLLWGTLLSAVLQSTQLVLATGAHRALAPWCSDELLVLGGAVGINVIQNVLGMPTMVLAARLCPPGMEGTMFAAIMAALNCADGVRYAGGAALTGALHINSGDVSAAATAATSAIAAMPAGWHNLPLLLIVCNAALLLPLPLLGLVPTSLDRDPSSSSNAAAASAATAASSHSHSSHTHSHASSISHPGHSHASSSSGGGSGSSGLTLLQPLLGDASANSIGGDSLDGAVPASVHALPQPRTEFEARQAALIAAAALNDSDGSDYSSSSSSGGDGADGTLSAPGGLELLLLLRPPEPLVPMLSGMGRHHLPCTRMPGLHRVGRVRHRHHHHNEHHSKGHSKAAHRLGFGEPVHAHSHSHSHSQAHPLDQTQSTGLAVPKELVTQEHGHGHSPSHLHGHVVQPHHQQQAQVQRKVRHQHRSPR